MGEEGQYEGLEGQTEHNHAKVANPAREEREEERTSQSTQGPKRTGALVSAMIAMWETNT